VTISDYLMQRAKKLTYWYMASFIPMGFVLIFKAHSFLFLFGSIVFMFGALVATMLLSSRAPCPSCLRPVGVWMTWTGQPKRSYSCPHCRVSIDEPMNTAPPENKGAEQNPASRP
jgi:hypothetical protein